MNMQTERTKRFLIAATGGTIASVETEDGLAPGMGGGDLIAGARANFPHIRFDISDIMSIDSSNMQPEDWQTIARAAFGARGTYDAVIVTHGTDTMAYSASALSYMLRDIDVPVVLTGSQIPFGAPCSDARPNIELAVSAADAGIIGVSVAFCGRVIAGTRAVKVSSTEMAAFDSSGAPLRAELRADGLCVMDRGMSADGTPTLMDGIDPNVALIKTWPGMTPRLLDAVVGAGARALVIEAFGAGGVSFASCRDISGRLGEIASRGVPVVVTTQCARGSADISLYEVGHRLEAAGAISCRDMTAEAALTKMMWALGNGIDPKTAFCTNYAGEVTL